MLDLILVGKFSAKIFFKKVRGKWIFRPGCKIGRNGCRPWKWVKFKKNFFAHSWQSCRKLLGLTRKKMNDHIATRRYFTRRPKNAYFGAETEITPHGTVWAARSKCLALGTSPRYVLLIMQPNLDGQKILGSQISGYLTSSTLKHLCLVHLPGQKIFCPGQNSNCPGQKFCPELKSSFFACKSHLKWNFLIGRALKIYLQLEIFIFNDFWK